MQCSSGVIAFSQIRISLFMYIKTVAMKYKKLNISMVFQLQGRCMMLVEICHLRFCSTRSLHML